jgi:two-component system, chemotaxis family, CheB/CheR fusion protein
LSLHALIPVRGGVKTRNGGWYSMRINPYRTTNNTIAGLVLSFIDISDYPGEKRKQ